MLDQRICRDGRPVAEVGNVACLGVGPRESLADPLCDGVRRICGSRSHLPNRDIAGPLIEKTNVGECAARIDPDAPTHQLVPRCVNYRMSSPIVPSVSLPPRKRGSRGGFRGAGPGMPAFAGTTKTCESYPLTFATRY